MMMNAMPLLVLDGDGDRGVLLDYDKKKETHYFRALRSPGILLRTIRIHQKNSKGTTPM